jgi:hypothetical protein
MYNLGEWDKKGYGPSTPNYQSAREWYTKALAANPPPELKAKIEKALSDLEKLLQKKRAAEEVQPPAPAPSSQPSEQPPAKKQK